jgi:hypothetical protein
MGKNKNETFIWYYLRKIYPKLSPQKTKFAARVVVPILLIGVGFILQVELGFYPLINIF